MSPGVRCPGCGSTDIDDSGPDYRCRACGDWGAMLAGTPPPDAGRYMLFAWDDYEAQGGAYDVVGRFDTIDAAMAHESVAGDEHGLVRRDQWQVLDMVTGEWGEPHMTGR